MKQALVAHDLRLLDKFTCTYTSMESRFCPTSRTKRKSFSISKQRKPTYAKPCYCIWATYTNLLFIYFPLNPITSLLGRARKESNPQPKRPDSLRVRSSPIVLYLIDIYIYIYVLMFLLN